MLPNSWHFFLKPSTFQTCCDKTSYAVRRTISVKKQPVYWIEYYHELNLIYIFFPLIVRQPRFSRQNVYHWWGKLYAKMNILATWSTYFWSHQKPEPKLIPVWFYHRRKKKNSTIVKLCIYIVVLSPSFYKPSQIIKLCF